MCIKLARNTKGSENLGELVRDGRITTQEKISEPIISLFMFEVVHIYLCIINIIIIIIIIIIKATVVFVMCFDIIHIRQYVEFMGCDMQYWHRCCVLLLDLQTAVDLFSGPSPYQILYP